MVNFKFLLRGSSPQGFEQLIKFEGKGRENKSAEGFPSMSGHSLS